MEVINVSRKLLDAKRDYLISEHRSGRTAVELARQLGVTSKVVIRVLGKEYRAIGRPANLPAENVVTSYKAGESENSIALRYNVSRRAVERVLLLAGIHRRSQSEAEIIRWAAMDIPARRLQVAAANKAARGRVCSYKELCLKAAVKQTTPKLYSSYDELLLSNMLKIRGIDCIPQLAIGPYNCDLAAFPITVEIWGGHWHYSGRHLARTDKRFRYILNAGWSILVVNVVKPNFPLTTAVADYVAAYINKIRLEPPMVCEYRVIWGAGKFTTAGSANDHKIAVIPPFTMRRNSATGKYETIPR